MNIGAIIVGFLLGSVVWFLVYIGIGCRNQTMTIYYPDGTWFLGVRKREYQSTETKGTHHFLVKDGSEPFKSLVGKKIAVPINSVKYYILEGK